MSDRVKLELGEGGLSVQPGALTEATLTVQNTSAIVDQYAIRIDGLDPAWLSISPNSVSLFPGDHTTVTISFSPPTATDAAAGTHPFTIVATSQDNPADSTQLEATLTVRPFGDLALGLSPEKVTGRQAKYLLAITNSGNADIVLNLAAKDEEDALKYSFEWDRITAPAGSIAEVGLDVSPKQARRTGEKEEHHIRVTAAREGREEEEPTAVEAVFEYTPMFGMLPKLPTAKWRWLLILIPILALAAYLAWPKASEELAKLTKSGSSGATPTSQGAPANQVTNTPQPTATAVAPPAVVNLNVAIPAGTPQPLSLSWEVERATTVVAKLNPDAGGAGPSVPSKTGDFSVSASNQGGQDSGSLELVIVGPPVIVEYYASPQMVRPGQPVKLVWTVLGADEGDVEGEKVDLTRSKEIRSDQSGSYILRVRNPVGEVSSITYVDVVPFPTATPTSTFTPTNTPTPTRTSIPTATATPTIAAPSILVYTASPAAITAATGSPVTLTWQVANATKVRISWNDAKGAQSFESTNLNSSNVVYPATTGPLTLTFNLEAYNSVGVVVGPVGRSVAVVAPVGIRRLIANAYCRYPTALVDVTWLAIGGPDAKVELYRSGLRTPIFTGTAADLSDTLKEDKPPSGSVSYTLVVYNSAGMRVQQTYGPVYPICIG